MTKYQILQIHFILNSTQDYNELVNYCKSTELNLEYRYWDNFNNWQEFYTNNPSPQIIILEYNPENSTNQDQLSFLLKEKEKIHVILYIQREHVQNSITLLTKGVDDYITPNAKDKIIPVILKTKGLIESEIKLRDKEIILRRVEKKNIALLNAQPDYMLQVSKDGLILDYKPSKESIALQEIFKNQELQGRELGEFFPNNVTHELIQRIQKVFETKQPDEYTFRLVTRGVQHKLEARIVRLSHIECLVIIREFQIDNEREEDYYRAISRISRYKHKENLVKELLNHMVNSDKNLLAAEKRKADLLLSNILPNYMIEDLKKYGKVQPVQYDNASVMFTDFVNFSKISKYMSPTQLLKELTIYFDEFERICETYGIEKVKTIGDSFLCVSGLGKNQKTATIDSILAGIEMARFTYERKEELESRGEEAWGIRIAIHSGPLIAGVVGHKKIAFDIWGHTVNTASRIEAISKGGSITVSRSVYDAARDFFDFEYAGEYELKGVGSLDLYVLRSLKSGLYHKNSNNHLIPNQNFYRLYEALRDGKHIQFENGKYKITSNKPHADKLPTSKFEKNMIPIAS